MYTRQMQFNEIPDGFVFSHDDVTVAIGVRDQGEFLLYHNNTLIPFANAMSAFVHLRSIYEPGQPKQSTLDLFEKPARAIDNMSKYKNNAILAQLEYDEQT